MIGSTRRLLTFATGLVLAAGTLAAAPQDGPTVWDGVYSEAQAARGQKAFVQSCGGCHRDDASGGDDSEPPLRGPNFTGDWEEVSVAGLYDFIATSMPRNRPGSLPLPECRDIVAFLLQLNGMPAGPNDLPADIEALARIRILGTRPSGR